MAAATAAERHAARTRIQRAPGRPQRRVSGRVGTGAKPRAVPAPRPGTGVFERLRAMPDHRIIDRLLRGRAWICFVGLALMGIVAMQVSLLKLNSGIGRAVETTATLERQNSEMEAQIARLASGERTRAAADRDGMVTPAAGAVHYLRVRTGDGTRAAHRMRAPSDAARELMANAGVVPGSLVAPPVTTTAAPAATATAGTTTTTTTAAAPAVTPAPTPVPIPAQVAPVAPAQQAPTTTAPSSGGTAAAAPTQPQG